MSTKSILCFAGSSRQQSMNKQLAKQAASIAQQLGADASFIDLAEYPLPIYNGDHETQHGLPDPALKLKAMFTAADALFIASPEYNGSFSPLLKNTLDWVSRSHLEDEPALSAYLGKVAGIASASPGGLGGLRGLTPLRMLLNNLGVTVVPAQVAVGSAFKKVTQGDFTDEATLSGIENIIKSVMATTT